MKNNLKLGLVSSDLDVRHISNGDEVAGILCRKPALSRAKCDIPAARRAMEIFQSEIIDSRSRSDMELEARRGAIEQVLRRRRAKR